MNLCFAQMNEKKYKIGITRLTHLYVNSIVLQQQFRFNLELYGIMLNFVLHSLN